MIKHLMQMALCATLATACGDPRPVNQGPVNTEPGQDNDFTCSITSPSAGDALAKVVFLHARQSGNWTALDATKVEIGYNYGPDRFSCSDQKDGYLVRLEEASGQAIISYCMSMHPAMSMDCSWSKAPELPLQIIGFKHKRPRYLRIYDSKGEVRCGGKKYHEGTGKQLLFLDLKGCMDQLCKDPKKGDKACL